MTWGVVAVAGASVVGGVMSSRSASKANKSAAQAAANELAFNQQRYDDWKEVYGGIQDNLSEYYSNITPDMYEVQGLEQFQQEFETSQQRLSESLAQRGIVDSGLSAQLEQQQQIGGAQERARIRVAAPTLAAEEQSRFLQIGLGQNPASSVAATLANRTAQTSANAQNAQRAAGQATATALGEVGNAITAIANYNPDATNGGTNG